MSAKTSIALPVGSRSVHPPPYRKPELLATAPNQLWSWDVRKLLGPAKWTYFYLYVILILDVFSRYVTGWMVAHRESAELAKRMIEESCKKQRIQPGQLTLHADRGTSMRSKPVAFLPTAKEAYKHLRLPVIDDAYENLHMLTVLSTLAPHHLDAGSCIVASRFRCRSCDRGIRCQSALDESLPSRRSS